MPKVSILVPCCNVEKFVYQCLDSIRNQTLNDIEVLCINDGSTDGTLNILRQFAETDSRFFVIDKSNSGYGDSMNLGLDRCTGKYIGIVESDDFIEPTMFERLLAVAEENDLDIARTGYFFYTDGVDVPEYYDFVKKNVVLNPLEEFSVFFQPPSIWASLYRHEMIKKNHIRFLPTPGASYQDTSFAFKCYFKCRRFMMLNTALLHYRQHAGGSVKSGGKVFCVCDEWDEILRFVKLDREGFNKVRGFIAEVREGTYLWNYMRLTGKNQREFLDRWSKDLRRMKEDDLPNFNNSHMRKRSWWIMHFPALFHLKKQIRSLCKYR